MRTFVFTIPGLVRVHQRTETSFRADDPWNGGASTDWNVDAFRWFGENLGGRGSAWSGYDIFALRSEIDGEVRFLPETLTVLWQQGRVPAAALPGLLAEESASLSRVDFAHFLHRRYGGRILAFLIATVLTLGALWVGPEGGIVHALALLLGGLSVVCLTSVVLLVPIVGWRQGKRRRQMEAIAARLASNRQ